MGREYLHAANNAINDAARRNPVDNLWQTSGNESRMTAGRAGSAAAGGGDRNLMRKGIKKVGSWVLWVNRLFNRDDLPGRKEEKGGDRGGTPPPRARPTPTPWASRNPKNTSSEGKPRPHA